jgi:hypothetical protein
MYRVDNVNIFVVGGTAQQKLIIQKAISFAKRRLMPLYRTLSINVKLGRLKNKNYGSAEWTDSNIRPREFQLQVTNIDKKTMLLTLFHEMVHVKQMASGELKERYKGEYYRIWKDSNVFTAENNDDAPWDFPWEIEADEWEEILYKEFKEYSNPAM